MQPVEYSGAVVAIVQAFNARPPAAKVASYWSADEVNPVRKVIKDHYIGEQQQRCCYCQHLLETNNNAVWDGEHVISREAKPQFMFEARNLAVACKDCNIAKREQNVLKNKDRITFPVKSSDYLIVHPHFDTYGDHLIWYGVVVAAASSDSAKGTATIGMCNLTRYSKQCGKLKGDIGDQRYRDRIGEFLMARTQEDAAEILAELQLQIGKLPKKDAGPAHNAAG
ncbi:hypothetical protein AB5I39_09650 [Sphingomonas sp. MMS24-J45]|uniref:hypothetical protein n=1 Tax=Sphingomonas sp. MMS24-J45 TaxID=3238806 RepID=UPI003850040E